MGTAGNGTYLYFGHFQCTAALGIALGRAFCITGVVVKGDGITNSSAHWSYSTTDERHFTATDYLTLYYDGVIDFLKNGSMLTITKSTNSGNSENCNVGVEIEFDD